jgi:hypothetical protein
VATAAAEPGVGTVDLNVIGLQGALAVGQLSPSVRRTSRPLTWAKLDDSDAGAVGFMSMRSSSLLKGKRRHAWRDRLDVESYANISS